MTTIDKKALEEILSSPDKKILNLKEKTELAIHIENLVLENDDSYIDAVLILCNEYMLDVNTISKILPEIIIKKMEKEAMARRMLPRKASLRGKGL